MAILGFLGWKVDFGIVWEHLKFSGWIAFAAATAVLFAQSFIMAWRWRCVARSVVGGAVELPFLVSFWRYLMTSFWFNLALPSSVGGDFVRIWLLTRCNFSLGTVTRGVILDRLSALVAVVLLMGLSLFGLTNNIADESLTTVLLGLIASAVLGTALLLQLDKVVARWRDRKIVDALAVLAINARTILRSPVIMISAVFVHALTIFSFYVIAKGAGLSVDAWEIFLVMPSIILMTALPISIAGWGVREGSVVVGFGLFGVSAEAAIAVSILAGLCAMSIGLIGGFVWLFERTEQEPQAGSLKNAAD